MKIGIFGDSYADPEIWKKETNWYQSWVEVLADKYGHEVTSYGKSASSLYYSYLNFIKNHELYEKVILVATVPHRIMIPYRINVGSERHRFINTYDTACHVLKNRNHELTKEGIAALEATKQYFLYLDDQEKNELYHNLLLDYIKKIRQDILIIDTFVKPNFGLFDVSRLETSSYKEYGYNDSGHILHHPHDYRRCHMTAKNNEIIADKVHAWATGNTFELKQEDFVVPDLEELEKIFYYPNKKS